MKIVNTFYVDEVFVNLDEKPAISYTELIVTNPTFRLLILEKVKIIICKVKYMDFKFQSEYGQYNHVLTR